MDTCLHTCQFLADAETRAARNEKAKTKLYHALSIAHTLAQELDTSLANYELGFNYWFDAWKRADQAAISWQGKFDTLHADYDQLSDYAIKVENEKAELEDRLTTLQTEYDILEDASYKDWKRQREFDELTELEAKYNATRFKVLNLEIANTLLHRTISKLEDNNV